MRDTRSLELAKWFIDLPGVDRLATDGLQQGMAAPSEAAPATRPRRRSTAVRPTASQAAQHPHGKLSRHGGLLMGSRGFAWDPAEQGLRIRGAGEEPGTGRCSSVHPGALLAPVLFA